MGMMNAKIYKDHKPGDYVYYATDCGPGLTKQEFRQESDINYIMKRYNATGQLPVNMQELQPIFADVSAMGDFASALRRTAAAEEAFLALPADLRSKFSNDPEQLVSFLQDPANADEAATLGLIEKKVAPPVLIQDPAPAAPAAPALPDPAKP